MKNVATIAISLVLLCMACQTASTEAEEGGTGTGVSYSCEDQLTESECGELPACEWVDVLSTPGPCEEGTTQAQCMYFWSPGAGCTGSFACDADDGPRTFVRDVGAAGVQVVQAEICGEDPSPDSEWQQCQWDEMGNVSPHEACACGC
jgi:hypothetical protein